MLGHVVGLGHLLRDQELVDLLLGAVSLLHEDVLDGLASLVGDLGGSRALLVANVGQQSSDDTDRVVEKLLALSLIGSDSINAQSAESLGGTGEHVDVVEHVVDQDGLHHVQLQLTSLRGETAGQISSDDLEASLVHDLRNDGVHLSGHDRATRSARRQVDLVQTAARTRSHQTQIVAHLRQLDGAASQNAREVQHTRGVRGSVDQIGGDLDVEAGDLTQGLHGSSRVVGVSSGSGTDGSASQVHGQEHLRSLLHQIHILLEGGSVGVELLSQSHGHGILKLGTTHLHHVLELLSLLLEGVDQKLHLLDQGEVVQVHSELSRAGVRIVGGLALVHDIVGADELVVTSLVSHNLQSTVGDDLVRVHVGGSSSSSLDHIHNELAVPLARDDLIASLLDGVGLVIRNQTKLVVGGDSSLLHHTVGLDVVGEVVQSLSRDIVAGVTTHGLDSVVVISRHLQRSQKIRLGTGGNSTNSHSRNGSELRRRLSKSKHSCDITVKAPNR